MSLDILKRDSSVPPTPRIEEKSNATDKSTDEIEEDSAFVAALDSKLQQQIEEAQATK